ncbi:MAG: iron-containing alcohol dehydrogenase [Firmicutes bacterium]|nr:iron-containing alcohol dehydrogenase [Bacillota bacterium]
MLHTNVKEIRYGEGAVEGVGDSLGTYVAVSMDVPWKIVSPKLGKQPEKVFLITNVEEEEVNKVLAETPDVDAIVGIGGGQAIDVAKYVAWKKNLPLINIPTIISTNAYVTPAAGIRKNGKVEYLGDVSPELVVVDYEIIRGAPYELNIAGAADILSIHTAHFDWQVATKAGEKAIGRSYPYEEDRVNRALTVLNRVKAGAQEIAHMTNEGIKLIVDAFLEINDICIPAGHFRAEEGSEHFLAYNAERVARKQFVHGFAVALGLHVMSKLQDNDHEGILKVMDEISLPHSPAGIGLTNSQMRETLQTLKDYVVKQNLWYSIIDEVDITEEFIEDIMSDF